MNLSDPYAHHLYSFICTFMSIKKYVQYKFNTTDSLYIMAIAPHKVHVIHVILNFDTQNVGLQYIYVRVQYTYSIVHKNRLSVHCKHGLPS